MNSKNKQREQRKLLPLGLTLAISLLLAGGLMWLNQATTVSANSGDYALAETTYPTIVGSRIDNCSLCHSSVPNLNPFGAAYAAGGRGKATSLTNIANTDSDGDGFTNIQEINAHTYPGDAADFPATATATATTPPTATATKTSTATATQPGPTATKTSTATATQPGPTATNTSTATATQMGSTATLPAATATQMGPTATKPAVTATTKPRMTGTPTVRPTPVKQCIRDDDKSRKQDKEWEHREGKKRSNPCSPGYHDREDHDDRDKKGDDYFKQIKDRVNSLLSGKKP